MHHAHTFSMDTQHFQAKLLEIKQIWHISQAKVYLQVGRYASGCYGVFVLFSLPNTFMTSKYFGGKCRARCQRPLRGYSSPWAQSNRKKVRSHIAETCLQQNIDDPFSCTRSKNYNVKSSCSKPFNVFTKHIPLWKGHQHLHRHVAHNDSDSNGNRIERFVQRHGILNIGALLMFSNWYVSAIVVGNKD